MGRRRWAVALHALELAAAAVALRRWRTAARADARALEDHARLVDDERRRIAADLHDGVLQDLAGSGYAVAALARRGDLPDDVREVLADAALRLRQGVRALRSVLVEIHPPNVHQEGLPTALGDLLTRLHGRGIETTLDTEVAPGRAPAPEHAELLYRVALETVRHALVDPRVRSLTVHLGDDGDAWRIEILDGVVADGTAGMRVADRRARLRGVATSLEQRGGRLVVTPCPRGGAVVRAWAPVGLNVGG